MRLSIKNLVCSYDGQVVVNDFNLTVGEANSDGEIVCLFGKSGCGKSTVLKSVAGLIGSDRGQIQVNGDLVESSDTFVAPEKRRVGMIFQDYALFPHLTALDNVAFSLPRSRRSEALELLALVELADKADSYPHQLSGGQQQRVAIARALAAKPEVLLMDEPFSNIDHQVRFELMHQIRRILKKKKISTIFVTHNKAEAFAFADRIAVMRDGAVVQHGEVNHVYLQPKDEQVARLLGKVNVVSSSWLRQAKGEGVLNCESEALAGQTLFCSEASKLLVRPQFLSAQLATESDRSAEVIELMNTGDNNYIRVEFLKRSLLVLVAPGQSFVVGDRVILSLLAHDYCYGSELDC